MSHEGTCRACGVPVIWALMPSGRLNPLNATEIPPEIGKGVTAFNPKTGCGLPVTIGNIDECPQWANAGATFHTSHFSDCPYRGQFSRREPDPPSAEDQQETLT